MGIARWLACATLATAAVAADPFADARRGSAFFSSASCLECHSVNGRGGDAAPDLGRRIGRDYTPSGMASTMWNHAPAMWAAMRKLGIERSPMDEARARDLFAYFYSARYFDKPGDSARGKRLFAENGCASCHAIAVRYAGGATPVARWQSLGDPIQLAQAMWSHPVRHLRRARATHGPRLTAQELTDMLVYLQNLPETRMRADSYSLAFAEVSVPAGRAAAPPAGEAKGCAHAQCHSARGEALLQKRTLVEVAVAVWNHAPGAAVMRGEPDERVRDYVSNAWAGQFLSERGSVARGRRVFAAKHCITCHSDPASGAPSLAQRRQERSSISMIAALWEHGPAILDGMNRRSIRWPRFTAAEMSDLITYLNSLPQRSGKPQPVMLRAEVYTSQPWDLAGIAPVERAASGGAER